MAKVGGLPLCHRRKATYPHRLIRVYVFMHIRTPASLQLRQRRVDLQRRAQVPRPCSADVVARKASHAQVLAIAKVVGLPLCNRNWKIPISHQITSTPTSTSPASLKLCQRLVDPQRRAKVPHACGADVRCCCPEDCPYASVRTGQGRGGPPSTCKPHFSVVSVVLTCSAMLRSRAPAAPMLLRKVAHMPCAYVSTV
jgi:hypothetical protein